MTTQTVLLALLVLILAWEFILRLPVLKLVRRIQASRQAPVEGPTVQLPRLSMTFLLCNAKGDTEYEITFHGTDAPERYLYAGKTYTQQRRRPDRQKQTLDVIWEYRR